MSLFSGTVRKCAVWVAANGVVVLVTVVVASWIPPTVVVAVVVTRLVTLSVTMTVTMDVETEGVAVLVIVSLTTEVEAGSWYV